MKIDGARIEGGELVFATADPAARRFVWNFKPGEYEITRAKKRRSTDANAKCWAMCEEIARAVGITKEEVYRRNIKEVGDCVPLLIKSAAAADFSRSWSSHGIGWFTETADSSPRGYKVLLTYKGSSVYDTAQMARLIDGIMQDGKSIGLDLISERERSLLLTDWERKQKQ